MRLRIGLGQVEVLKQDYFMILISEIDWDWVYQNKKKVLTL